MLKERLLNDGNLLYILKDRTLKSSRTVRGAQSLYIGGWKQQNGGIEREYAV